MAGNTVHAAVCVLRVADFTKIGVTTATTQPRVRILGKFLQTDMNLTVLYFRAGFFEAGALMTSNAPPVSFGKYGFTGIHLQGKPAQAHRQRYKPRKIGFYPAHNFPHILTMAGQKMTAGKFGLLVEFSQQSEFYAY
jgi:hypothetical protein